MNVFPLQDVIDDLLNSNQSLIRPLMRLNYFGRHISNDELVGFTLNELNGYSPQDNHVPEYRKTPARLIVTMRAHVHTHVAEVPISMLESPLDEGLKYISLREGVGTLEKMAGNIGNNPDERQVIGNELPMESLQFIQPVVSKLYKSDVKLVAIGARVTGNGYIVINALSNVRTKLLTFVMDIAEMFGLNIEIESFNKNRDTNNQIIINIMHTVITNTGDGNFVNTGDNASIHASIKISKGDLEGLKKQLSNQGVEDEDIRELTEIVQAEQPNFDKNVLGEKSNNWILKIIGKALSGAGKIATGLSANLLATLIKQYYGMPG